MRLKASVVCTSALAAVIAFSPVMPAAAQVSGAAIASQASVASIRIDNFGQVNPNYFRGAQPVGRDYADLAALGVKTVIDLQRDGDANEATMARRAGLNFYRIPMTTRIVPTADQLATFLKLVHDPANQPVYVHCAGGRHRTGVMTAVYRMEHDGWTNQQAFKEMKSYKFGFDFLHPEFKQFVSEYRPVLQRAAVDADTLR